jgi:predicted DNA-binding ribbon-helix-helix protein
MDTQVYKMPSRIIKHSVKICGHPTSVSLEKAYWDGLKEIAAGKDMTLSELVDSIELDRRHGNLSSALRLFVLDHYKELAGKRIAA